MKTEIYKTTDKIEIEIGYSKKNDSTTSVGLGLYPELGVQLSIWKFRFNMIIKLDKLKSKSNGKNQ